MRQATPYNQWISSLWGNLLTGWDQDCVDNHPETFTAVLCATAGPLGQFYINLEYGGRYLETGRAFLCQDLRMGNEFRGHQEYVSEGFRHCLGTNRA